MESVTELPFNQFIGIETGSEEESSLRLPSGGQYLNHLGTVHAGALLALAEAASGEYLLRNSPSGVRVIPVVRRLEAKFRKPANGTISANASVLPEALAQLSRDLSSKGRSLISVAVELHDQSGAHVLSASVEWFIQFLPPSSPEANGQTAQS